jgi:hypothetical protein
MSNVVVVVPFDEPRTCMIAWQRTASGAGERDEEAP